LYDHKLFVFIFARHYPSSSPKRRPYGGPPPYRPAIVRSGPPPFPSAAAPLQKQEKKPARPPFSAPKACNTTLHDVAPPQPPFAGDDNRLSSLRRAHACIRAHQCTTSTRITTDNRRRLERRGHQNSRDIFWDLFFFLPANITVEPTW
jgi:hypothetical protein